MSASEATEAPMADRSWLASAQTSHAPPARPLPRSTSLKETVSRGDRLRKGTRYEDAYDNDPFAPIRGLESFSSASAVQEYIAALVRRDPHDVELLTQLPRIRYEDGESEGEPAVEAAVWVYEHIRRVVQDQHLWIATLMSDCTAQTCPEMQAGPDWYFLCAAHEVQPSPPCCAIDYISHTSDGAQALLTSPRYFPSRLSISESSRTLLSTVARRIYRSFAHAYFHHEELFVELESQTSLVRRFVALSRRFDLMPPDALIIPDDALREGGGGGLADDGNESDETERGDLHEERDDNHESELSIRAV